MNVILGLVSALLFLILAVSVLLWIWSPGKPQQYVDSSGKVLAGSVSEKVYLNINGVKQGMIIKGKNDSKPVLLYIHGGLPFTFLAQDYPTGLENDFVLVWWEQRGSGMSFHSNLPPQSVTTEQLIADLFAVTNYLRQRFGQKKIYLMGHSGGSFIGIQAAAKAPELFHAYIGVAQMANQLKSEKLAYDYMLERFRKTGNTKMVERLEAAPVTSTSVPKKYLAIRDGAMHKLGIGTMHTMHSVITGIFLPSWRFR